MNDTFNIRQKIKRQVQKKRLLNQRYQHLVKKQQKAAVKKNLLDFLFVKVVEHQFTQQIMIDQPQELRQKLND